nr:lysophospholipid acyltransferase family protein [Neoroseomonas soli]
MRSVLFNALFLGGTAVVAVFGLPLLLAPPAWLMGYVRAWAQGVVALLRVICGIRLEVTGLENIPPGGAIIAAKHQSAFDTVVWLMLLPAGRPMPVYVLKKELLSIPAWGLLARRCGHIAVDRKAGAQALRGMVRAGQAVLAAGRPIVIFPEGTRTAPGERIPYQPGVAALALATQAPVVPAATDSGLTWGRRAFHKRPGVIRVSVLPPLPSGLPRAALMKALESAIETESDRLARMSPSCG